MKVFIDCRVIVLLIFGSFRDQLLQRGGPQGWPLLLSHGSESRCDGFNLQKSLTFWSGFIKSVFHQTEGQFLVSDKHRDTRSLPHLLLFQFFSVVLQLFLIDGPDISEPPPIWLNLTGVRVLRGQLHFLNVGFSLIHVQSIDCRFGTELGAFFTPWRIWPIRVGRRSRFLDRRPFLTVLRSLGRNKLFVVFLLALFPVGLCFLYHYV